MWEWKGIEKNTGKVNSTKSYGTNDETSLSVLTGCYTGLILNISYLILFDQADIPPETVALCFPEAVDWRPHQGSAGAFGQNYSLVYKTTADRVRFLYCRRGWEQGRNMDSRLLYCFVTKFRARRFYYKILTELMSHRSEPHDLNAILQELYNFQFPGPGQGISLITTNKAGSSVCEEFVYRRVTALVEAPSDLQLDEGEVTQLFSAVGVSTFLHIFGAFLEERTVIVTSNWLSRLSSCIEVLQSLLYPFEWQHQLVSVMHSPEQLPASETPYFWGILRGRDGNMELQPVGDSLVVDLDNSQVVHRGGNEGTFLPTRMVTFLKDALQIISNTTVPQTASQNVILSEAFLKMFVEICGHYDKHIAFQEDGTKVFKKEAFIKAAADDDVRRFLVRFTETAMFSAFIDSLLKSESDIHALKNLGSKAEQLMEKKKHEVEDIANQKKQMASEMVEEQAKKTGDAIWSTKSELETAAVGGAMDAKHTAIDSFDEEFSKAEKAVDSTIDQASTAVDAKMKEADKFIDEKREQVGKVVKETTEKVVETKDQTSASVLGKAKGILNL